MYGVKHTPTVETYQLDWVWLILVLKDKCLEQYLLVFKLYISYVVIQYLKDRFSFQKIQELFLDTCIFVKKTLLPYSIN